MNEAERDRQVYSLAQQYLWRLPNATPQTLERYLYPNPRPDTVAEIYQRILELAQLGSIRANVIGRSLGGVEKLGAMLCNFEPRAVLVKYPSWEAVLDAIETFLNRAGKIRRTPRGIWPQYCQTILTGARFMSQFDTADDFYRWVSFFDNDDRARHALPMLLAREIKGFGFAMGCDFLKELSFMNFAKPDAQIREIFVGLGLCPAKADDYQLFKAMVRLANNAGVSPQSVDRLFWLIGSADSHDDRQTGKNGISSSDHKAKFLAEAKAKMDGGGS